MIKQIPKIIQFIFICLTVIIIVYPTITPPLIRPTVDYVHHWVFGNELSYVSFITLWQQRWYWLTKLFPGIGQEFNSVPSLPNQITADSLINSLKYLLYDQPIAKWHNIKHQLYPF